MPLVVAAGIAAGLACYSTTLGVQCCNSTACKQLFFGRRIAGLARHSSDATRLCAVTAAERSLLCVDATSSDGPGRALTPALNVSRIEEACANAQGACVTSDARTRCVFHDGSSALETICEPFQEDGSERGLCKPEDDRAGWSGVGGACPNAGAPLPEALTEEEIGIAGRSLRGAPLGRWAGVLDACSSQDFDWLRLESGAVLVNGTVRDAGGWAAEALRCIGRDAYVLSNRTAYRVELNSITVVASNTTGKVNDIGRRLDANKDPLVSTNDTRFYRDGRAGVRTVHPDPLARRFEDPRTHGIGPNAVRLLDYNVYPTGYLCTVSKKQYRLASADQDWEDFLDSFGPVIMGKDYAIRTTCTDNRTATRLLFARNHSVVLATKKALPPRLRVVHVLPNGTVAFDNAYEDDLGDTNLVPNNDGLWYLDPGESGLALLLNGTTVPLTVHQHETRVSTQQIVAYPFDERLRPDARARFVPGRVIVCADLPGYRELDGIDSVSSSLTVSFANTTSYEFKSLCLRRVSAYDAEELRVWRERDMFLHPWTVEVRVSYRKLDANASLKLVVVTGKNCSVTI